MRMNGSRVDVGGEHITRLSTRAHFPVSSNLELRLLAQRDLMGDRPVVADRRLIVETETFLDPAHVDELPIG
jgi:hypothetical protein